MTYCHICDKNISQKFIRNYNKSKTHLYFYNNFIINRYYIGNVLWENFENILHNFINEYNTKFQAFSIVIRCILDDENINISIDNKDGEVPLYRFKNIGWVFYK